MKRTQLLAAVGASALAVAVLQPVADARPTRASSVAIKRLDASAAEHNRIVAYWTPQRMRSAIPADRLVAGRDTSGASGKVAAGKPTKVRKRAIGEDRVRDENGVGSSRLDCIRQKLRVFARLKEIREEEDVRR